ncbi:FRG domain-containing protein [Kosakonia sp. SOY2]|uniref:FRG domain-containing protein n=1 Tax=Kosakonia sp. SOY2 TaxID=3014557 RepID=UPI0022AC31DF|nr:FRG domain-containing protein [Kosakonia sp. SOY2]MCZ3385068.1 FRG domain-containing protein [Kosakonia sp. SOY2]
MINFIMGGFPEHYDYWITFKQKSGDFFFPLARVFEGTPENIRKKLTPLNSSAIAYIENLPVIFMTEAYNIDDEDFLYVDIRIGKISKVSLSGKNINFHFEINKEYNKIQIRNKNFIIKKLDFGSYGLNRTHWAIKEKGIDEILKLFGIETDEKAVDIPAPLPDEQITNTSIDNLQTFIKIVLDSQSAEDEETFYRGHSDSSYELAPSLFRRNKNSNFRYLHAEASLVREALSARPSEFIDDRTMLDKLVRMQHYGLPTRLLDITSNPLMALYFACNSIKIDENGNEIDGQVIIFKTPRKRIKFFDSDTVSCISNLSMLSQELKDKLDITIEKSKFNETEACLKLTHYIKDEKPYFQNVINPEDLEKIIFVKSRINNERISSQSGAFLLFGNNAVFPDITSESQSDSLYNFKTERITIKNKQKILEDLATLNITDATVYQGLERTMKLIANKYSSEN